jgi:uncharacterized protein (DUF1330 family)
MPAYLTILLDVHDPSWLGDYVAPTRAIAERHGARYLAAGTEVEHVEGDGAVPDSVVLIEFPDRASAKAFLDDPEYKPLKALRQAGSTGNFYLV